MNLTPAQNAQIDQLDKLLSDGIEELVTATKKAMRTTDADARSVAAEAIIAAVAGAQHEFLCELVLAMVADRAELEDHLGVSVHMLLHAEIQVTEVKR